MSKKITIVGLGYVGMSLCTLISQKYWVIGLDTDKEKVNSINKGVSPILDKDISNFFINKKLNLEILRDVVIQASKITSMIFILLIGATIFSLEIVKTVITQILEVNRNVTIIIKSTVPIGFTEQVKIENNYENIIFSPEFLREGKSLNDNLYPSRIIIGDNGPRAVEFGEILKDLSLKKDTSLIYMNSKEAEAVKLFSNTYLAMRVAFFNELDTFSEINNLSSLNIINGISLDERIGNYYNNPSFGYGGYCLPKDTRQLLSNYKDIPNDIIKSVIKSNETRKEFIVNSIAKKNPSTVGIYRLLMKKDSDNFKESAILDIVNLLKKRNIKVLCFDLQNSSKILSKEEILNKY